MSAPSSAGSVSGDRIDGRHAIGAESGLVVEGVRVGYPGGPDVLRGVSLSVRPGELVVVLGRNGAGKTTLLRAISGLLPCRSGECRIGTASLRGMRAFRIARRGLAHVPEGRRVIPGMSVADNLRLGAFPIAHRRDVDDTLAEVLELFPSLRRTLSARAGTLSGGQQQMLAIARALMSRPRVLLLDEPLTGLAPVIQDDVMATLSRLRADERTILLVEQNAARSLAIADRGVVLVEGEVGLEGAASTLATDPRVKEGYLGIRPEDNQPNSS
ncbi:branched-chain amino acid transport system ATP-binding protein [Antricoccus suffuscus]|uniref:Branched-chain amino acid transport system ATP-binding protein n=1 Tax=Antricoccus suffuscus TaxID=1629062 RepID=A0A2T1A6U9_9ACTN|nr:ABC transporter ATP-binding protein [Antricoccus suffuscus]PRZ44320.1 branched-chain amino acid transport system ATP-binding protein [Antricoccus suffuscus]